MPDTDDQVASLEAQMEAVRAERDAADADFRRRLQALKAQIKVAHAQAALAAAEAEAAQTTTSEES